MVKLWHEPMMNKINEAIFGKNSRFSYDHTLQETKGNSQGLFVLVESHVILNAPDTLRVPEISTTIFNGTIW